MSIPTLTTEQLIKDRIGQTAIDLRKDDLTGVLPALITEASTRTHFYLGLLYSDAALAGSVWVQYQCTNIAIYLLCLRRLNSAPASIKADYEATLEILEKIRSGQIQIPGVAMRRAMAPSLGNQRVDMWPVPHVVTSPSRSAGLPKTTTPGPEDLRDFDPNQ